MNKLEKELHGKQESDRTKELEELTQTEKVLLRRYRALNDCGKLKLLELADCFLNIDSLLPGAPVDISTYQQTKQELLKQVKMKR